MVWKLSEPRRIALGDARAIGPLTQALQEADGDVRQVVAWAIGRLRDHNAIESLIVAQLDPNSSVRQATSAALDQIDYEWTKSEAAQRTLPPLKRALKHEDYGVRQTAADLLNRIFNIRQCEPALLADVDAESARRQRAVDVLASVLWDEDAKVRFAPVALVSEPVPEPVPDDAPIINELVVCSDAGEVLYETGSENATARSELCLALANGAARLQATLPVGALERVEFLGVPGRVIARFQDGQSVFLRADEHLP